jgi:biopolymer transport protein ExbB/TolQ
MDSDMAITPSQRPTREWPLLVLALILVCAICVPLWQWYQPGESQAEFWQKWTPERLGRLLLGPVQILCYCFFTWAALILLNRYLEMRRQRSALRMGMLPTDEGARILPEDARPLQRRLDTLTRRRPYILANMIRLALSKYAISRSSTDASEAVRNRAEVDMSRLVSSMATVHYLAWAIPALGFLGTVYGLAGALGMATGNLDEVQVQEFISRATGHLNFAFDCTLVSLVFSIAIMFLLHSVQRDEEAVVIDCQQYCQEHLINRLYDLEPAQELAV